MFGRGVASIRCRHPRDQRFVELVLRNASEVWLALETSGSVFGNARRSDLEDFVVGWPSEAGRSKIVAILSAYDDLVESSLRRIEILEEVARRLYREWFVEFRFPGHERARFVDSPLGPIPEGWEVRALGDVANVTMGQSPRSEFYNETGEGLPFHQGVASFDNRFPTTNVHSSRGTRLAAPGDLLFSVRAPVGRINVAPSRTILGRGLCGIRHRFDHQHFLFYQLKENFKKEDSMGGGTIFKAVTKREMLGVRVLVPNGDLERAFEERVEPGEVLIESLTKRNAALREARDLLLPRLISGDLDVSDLPVRARPLYLGPPRRLTGYRFFRDIAALPFVEKVALFGSRARGDHEERSDIDLCVSCGGAGEDEWLEVLACLERDRVDTLLKVDCTRFETSDAALRENVLTEGIVLFERRERP